jgi:hypothetical protein
LPDPHSAFASKVNVMLPDNLERRGLPTGVVVVSAAAGRVVRRRLKAPIA